VPQGIRQPDQTGGDLQVKEITRRLSGPKTTQTNLLAASMHDHESSGIDYQFPKIRQRPGRQGVDQDQPIFGRYLHQTQVGMVTILADKLGVETQPFTAR
jgi:hypothetical protein